MRAPRPRGRGARTERGSAARARAAGPGAVGAIAGGETAGSPCAAWIPDRFELPMLYVRKQPKGFARMGQIEGVMDQRCRVLLVEDMATDGGSTPNVINALRNAGGGIASHFVVCYSEIFHPPL